MQGLRHPADALRRAAAASRRPLRLSPLRDHRGERGAVLNDGDAAALSVPIRQRSQRRARLGAGALRVVARGRRRLAAGLCRRRRLRRGDGGRGLCRRRLCRLRVLWRSGTARRRSARRGRRPLRACGRGGRADEGSGCGSGRGGTRYARARGRGCGRGARSLRQLHSVLVVLRAARPRGMRATIHYGRGCIPRTAVRRGARCCPTGGAALRVRGLGGGRSLSRRVPRGVRCRAGPAGRCGGGGRRRGGAGLRPGLLRSVGSGAAA